MEPPAETGDNLIRVVRIDPGKARLRALLQSELGGPPRTASQWCREFQQLAVINAGMFQAGDRKRHVGYMRSGAHDNSKTWVKSYRSLLVFGPRRPGIPAAQMIDLEESEATGARQAAVDYDVVSQNLRLIRSPGVNTWSNLRRWSEAAVAEDRSGRILFLFSRSPFTMAEFNRRILVLPLDIVRAAHMEGGPEASLSICAPGAEEDLQGSYETGFFESDDNHRQWTIPSVLGVAGGQ